MTATLGSYVRQGGKFLVASFTVLTLTGCAVAKIEKEFVETVALEQAPATFAEHRLLDVGIIEFDPGLAKDRKKNKDFVYPEIREAEARFIPYHLKSTLERAGYWGAVRVLPADSAHTDLYVRGRIVRSDGERAKLSYTATDAVGRVWLEESYETRTGRNSYSDRRDYTDDPYQNVYNAFANDLAAALTEFDDQQLMEIRRVSELQFMGDLAPQVFGDYLLASEKGLHEVQRLPSDDDPMADRLRRIRERDQLFIDTLNEHYANFYYGIAIPYEGWRKAAREEVLNYKELRRSATRKQILGIVVAAAAFSADTSRKNNAGGRAERAIQNMIAFGGLEAVKSGFHIRAEANLHKESIRELAQSFSSEAADMVVNVRGQTRRLSGSAEAQYDQWRKLLYEIYQAETGFMDEPEISAPVRAPQPTG